MLMACDSAVRHPALRYHGAKFRLAPWIMQFFPAHRCYVEPFGGAAGESVVSAAAKRGLTTFFAKGPGDSPGKGVAKEKIFAAANIRQVVEWSKTQRGGQRMDWIRIHEEPKACESAYGLCE